MNNPTQGESNLTQRGGTKAIAGSNKGGSGGGGSGKGGGAVAERGRQDGEGRTAAVAACLVRGSRRKGVERAPRGRMAAATETMMLAAQTKSRITKTKILGGGSGSQDFSAVVADGTG